MTPELSTSVASSTLVKKDVFETAYTEIQGIVDDATFGEAEKKVLVLHELGTALGIQSNPLEKSIPGLESLYNLSQAAYDDISAFAKAGDKTKLKNIVTYRTKQLQKDPYVMAVNGGAEATDSEKTAISTATISSTEADSSAAMSVDTAADGTVTLADKKDDTTMDLVKPETDADKLAKMMEENKKLTSELTEVKGQMKKYGPGLIRLSLAMHPTEIPTYLRQKYRNRGVGRMGNDIYAQLYHLSDGSFRRFTKQKTRVEKAPALCDALIAKNEKIANDKTLIPAKTIIAERRLVVLKQIKEILGHMKTVDAKNILAGK